MKKIKITMALMISILAFSWMAISFYPMPAIKADLHEIGSMDFRCYDVQGNLKWEELNRSNALADEGEYLFLDITLRNGTAPSNYYLRLYNTTPGETSTLGAISTYEPTGNGYAAQTVERSNTGWPTLALDSGDYQATSSTETFTATGAGWGPVTYCVMATSSDNSGKLVSYVGLSQSRTLAAGESLQVTYKLKLQ